MRFYLIAGVNLVFLAVIYYLLCMGMDAQRTWTYSVLKGLEDSRMLTMKASQLIETPQGACLISMEPLKQFYYAVIIVCILWVLFVMCLLLLFKGGGVIRCAPIQARRFLSGERPDVSKPSQ